MMNSLKHDHERIFGGAGLHSLKVGFGKQRKHLALKLRNPRIRRITFHTLRHWKATMLYHEVRDILIVMKTLGHKDVRNTLLYIDLEAACYASREDNFVAKVATSEKEICSLVEAGFEYVCECEHGKVFRKRK
jgi:integrase